jgi:hypothetical protein
MQTKPPTAKAGQIEDGVNFNREHAEGYNEGPIEHDDEPIGYARRLEAIVGTARLNERGDWSSSASAMCEWAVGSSMLAFPKLVNIFRQFGILYHQLSFIISRVVVFFFQLSFIIFCVVVFFSFLSPFSFPSSSSASSSSLSMALCVQSAFILFGITARHAFISLHTLRCILVPIVVGSSIHVFRVWCLVVSVVVGASVHGLLNFGSDIICYVG